MEMSFPPPFEVGAYEPPQSLWALVESTVPDSEQDEIKNLLGVSLVEQSKELHQEISMLLDIWQEYREETDELQVNFNPLPEPPQARDRLVQEIRFFVDSIKERAKEQGKTEQQVMAKHNADVLEYVMDTTRSSSSGYGSRPSTSRSSRDGRLTPLKHGTVSSGRESQMSTLSDDIQTITSKFDFLKLDEVSLHLRQTLEDEVKQLVSDIAFLQGCLEEEADYRSESRASSNPSLMDLKEERSKLEKQLLTDTSVVPSVLREDAMQPKPPITPPQRTILSGGLRRTPAAPIASPKTLPLKASHSLVATISGKPKQLVDVNKNMSGERILSKKAPGEPRKSANALTRGQPLSDIKGLSGSRTKDLNQPADGSAIPTPPSKVKPSKNAATRFRKMVHDCRD